MSNLKTGHSELVFEKFFKEYITVWYQARSVDAATWDKARKELELLKGKKGKKKGRQDDVAILPENTKCKDPAHKSDRAPSAKSEPAKYRLQQKPDNIHVSTKPNAELQRIIGENSALKQKVDHLKEKIGQLRAELYSVKDENDKQLDRLSNALDNSRAQVEDLTLRLSKLAGDKLRDGNPDLADLSDPYRPTELGKHFNELYDNEWSDAFEKLPLKDEEKKVGLLHGIVMKAYEFSCKKFEGQTNQIRNVLLGCAEIQDNEPAVEVKGEKTIRISKIHNQLKDLRKELAGDTAKNVAEEFQSTLGLYLSGFDIVQQKIDPTLNKYAKACVKLCWFMVTSDPPLALSEDKKDQAFNTNVYRPYTKSVKGLKNPVVRLHVWPALLLHVKGPLVAKGVAQPGEGKIK